MTEAKRFEKEDFKEGMPDSSFESCTFQSCTFTGANLRQHKFVDCEFHDCELSNVLLTGTVLQDVSFSGCRLLGVHFETLNNILLSFSFTKSTLDYSVFQQLQIHKTSFVACSLREVDFSDADLSGSSFRDAQLTGATFDNTSLMKCDFRGAQGFNISPVNNRIKKAIFDRDNLEGLLTTFGIDVE
ncbi:MAG: pentapeptide repeat-containing protein [Cryomorphaceae bacterium]|nr:pentapeptide repeat-containing protein [Cryomorphaceae bacterium]